MEPNVQKFIKHWGAKRDKIREEIASKKRSLELAEDKLARPEYWIEKDSRKGAVKTSLILADQPVRIKKPILIKNRDLAEKVPASDPSEVLPPAAVEPESTPGTLFG